MAVLGNGNFGKKVSKDSNFRNLQVIGFSLSLMGEAHSCLNPSRNGSKIVFNISVCPTSPNICRYPCSGPTIISAFVYEY
jgi:hypothetical protein